MEHHADFAVPITHRLWIETTLPRAHGGGTIGGRAIALGWWVESGEKPGDAPPPTGTLYLIVDEAQAGSPIWVAQGNIARCRFED